MRRLNHLITLVVTLIIFTEQGTGQENYPRTTSGDLTLMVITISPLLRLSKDPLLLVTGRL